MAQFPTVRAGVSNVPMPKANADWQATVDGLFGGFAEGQQYGVQRDMQTGTQQLLGQAGPNPKWQELVAPLAALGNVRGAGIAADMAQSERNEYWRGQDLDLKRRALDARAAAAAADPGYGPASRYEIRTIMNPDGSQSVLRIDKFTGEGTPVQQPAGPGATGSPVVAAPKPQAARPLPSSAINNLNETGATATTLDNIAGGFKPDYAGQPVTGDFWNYVGRTYGGSTQAQAEWWQQYQSQKNVLRNKLFGSALTATEKGEFEKADINPGMDPKVIQTNLDRQRKAAQAAARKIAAGYLRSGYPPEAIEGALGIPLGDLGITDQASTSANRNNYTPPQPTPGSTKNEERMPYGTPPATYRAPAGGGPAEGSTATNPETGERIMFQGGQWVPM